MPFDVKQYLSELAKSAGVADDKLQAALEVIGNEKVSKALGDGFLRQEVYSRNMDGLTKKQKELTDWYQQQVALAASNQKVVDETVAKLKSYEETYGTLDGTGRQPSVDTSQFIDKKTFEEAQAKLGQQFIAVTKTATKCSADYMKRFNEVLDMDELEKFTLNSGLPLAAAYEKFIEPRVSEITNKSFEEKLKLAREEGRQEAMSQKSNPTDTGSPAPNGFMANAMKSAGASSTLSEGFLDAWTKAAAKQ